MKCKMCGEGILFPMEAEMDNGICIMCMEGLAEDVDDGSAMPVDEFAEADLKNEEVRIYGI